MNTPKPHTLLTALAITTLVLTGCGNTTQTAPLPEPTTSSTSASTTPTATDAATSTATADPAQASASPSQAYSGGSKAPEGEYRAADEFGPAQNVSKPVAPEGMHVESPEALFLFVEYWNDMRNYANQTGDISSIQPLVDESFEQEQKYYDSLQKIYESGGWVIGGSRIIHYSKDLLISHGNGEYSIGSNFEVENTVLWVNNEARAYDNSDSIYKGIDLRLKFFDGSWKVLSAKVVS
ncbi:DUF6318 family protein [Rothia nasimurium]|uniref:DUF6318 family protein n=1 Tax=Rothia nasimurium TaxID=85336 RepID=UPI003BA2E3C2